MKLPFLPGILLTVILSVSTPDASAKKKKHKTPPTPADASIPQPGAKPDYSEPAIALAPYIANLEQLLALQRSGTPQLLDFLEKASGDLTVAKVEFSAERKKADAEDQPEFDAAVATCDAITRSLEERQKVIGDINASRAVKGSGKLQDGPRRDNLGLIEAQREKDTHKGAVKSAGQADDALTAMSLNRWNKRSIELRKYIADAYAKTK